MTSKMLCKSCMWKKNLTTKFLKKKSPRSTKYCLRTRLFTFCLFELSTFN